ncbi:hypothetical protein BJX76DRAFT_352627 [Aspergillus varians]
MPPKRASGDPASSRRSKTNTANDQASNSRSTRWSAASVSANIEQAYLEHRDYDAYQCLCQARLDRDLDEDEDDEDEFDEDEDDDEDDDKDEDEDEDDDDDKPRPNNGKCDGGETCICTKPAAEHPEHPFTITVAGYLKLMHQFMHTDLRTPDCFSMYIFNDFSGYGVMEILQNLILDFVEAKDNWKEQWAVCEAIPFYWLSGAVMPFTMLDGDTVTYTCNVLGHMFLAMLATLESRDLLKPDSEVKNLSVVMAMYLVLADELRGESYLEFDFDQSFDVSRFDAYVLKYSEKYMINLQGPSKIEELIDNIIDEDEEEEEEHKIKLPHSSADPWKWAAAHEAYAEDLGQISMVGKKGMGGDSFDITSWTSAARKKHSFTKKDPLTKMEINAVKEGLILQLG